MWVCPVGIVNDMNAFVYIVLKDIITPGIDLTRLFGYQHPRTGDVVLFSGLHIYRHPGFRLIIIDEVVIGIATGQAHGEPYACGS